MKNHLLSFAGGATIGGSIAILALLPRLHALPRISEAKTGGDQGSARELEEARIRVLELEQETNALRRRLAILRDLQAAWELQDESSKPARAMRESRAARLRCRALGAKWADLIQRTLAGEKISAEDWDPLMQELSVNVTELMGTFGSSGRQALYSPGGLGELLLGFLDSIPPKLTDGQSSSLESALDRAELAWIQRTQEWKGKSGLERDLESLEVEMAARNAIMTDATPDQLRAVALLDQHLSSGTCDQVLVARDPSTLPAFLAKDWGDKLSADPKQRHDLDSIAGRFCDDCEREYRELERGIPPGAKPDWRERQCAELRVMLAARKRMEEELSLTPEQRQIFDAWEQTYSWFGN